MLLVTRLAGGLGNQLFQYCAAKHYEDLLGVESTFILKRPAVHPNPNIEDVLPAELPRASSSQRIQVGEVPDHWSNWKRTLCRRLLSIGNRIRPAVRVHESQDSAEVIPHTIPRHARRVLLDGYFQLPRLYEPHLQDVCREILKRRPGRRADLGANRIAVHFRRGDFVPLGWALDWSYYMQAIDSLPISKERTRVWVVSDDSAFGELATFRLAAEGYIVEKPPAVDPSPALNDFWVLATAENLVSSNSSFAWWAAAVGDTLRCPGTHRVVIPRPWIDLYAPDRIRRAHWTSVGVSWTGPAGRS